MKMKLPSPALVIACLALFVAIGGTGYAATNLAGGADRSAGHGKKKPQPKRGPKGAQGPAGATGATGAQGVPGKDGAAGKDGAPGRNLTAETPLSPGQTETGIFSAAGSGAPGYLVGVVTFIQPLSQPLDGTHVIELVEGEPSAPHCPGVGKAEAGYLCVYATEEGNVTPDGPPQDPGTGTPGAGKDGAQAYYTIVGAGASYVYGTWALTAP